MLPLFFYENKPYILFGTYLIISLSLLITQSPRVSSAVKSTVSTAIFPFQLAVNEISNTVDEFWNSINELKRIKKEMHILKQQVEKLKGASIEIEELKRENERLRLLLENKKRIEFPTVYAEIIARDPSNYYTTFIINVGRKSGILSNMPVIAYQNGRKGVVGRIIEVSINSARVLPIIGVGSYVGAMILPLRYTGIIKGIGPAGDYLLLEYIDKEAMINFGEEVITSGQGGIFPKGLLIGKIVGFTKVKYGIFYKEIKVKPVIDFSRLEDVYVIIKKHEPQIIDFYREEH